MELYYWKDERHREVDFVVKIGQSLPQLIQVCWDMGNAETKSREFRSLNLAMKELGLKEATVITKEYQGDETVSQGTIHHMMLHNWLLTEILFGPRQS